MLNQTTRIFSLAEGCRSRISLRAHLAPAWQTGHVGENSNTSRGVPTSALNAVRSWFKLRSSTIWAFWPCLAKRHRIWLR
jgi:hypothetical protein